MRAKQLFTSSYFENIDGENSLQTRLFKILSLKLSLKFCFNLLLSEQKSIPNYLHDYFFTTSIDGFERMTIKILVSTRQVLIDFLLLALEKIIGILTISKKQKKIRHKSTNSINFYKFGFLFVTN